MQEEHVFAVVESLEYRMSRGEMILGEQGLQTIKHNTTVTIIVLKQQELVALLLLFDTNLQIHSYPHELCSVIANGRVLTEELYTHRFQKLS